MGRDGQGKMKKRNGGEMEVSEEGGEKQKRREGVGLGERERMGKGRVRKTKKQRGEVENEKRKDMNCQLQSLTTYIKLSHLLATKLSYCWSHVKLSNFLLLLISLQYTDRQLVMFRAAEQRQNQRVFCYNCAQKGHFGFVSNNVCLHFSLPIPLCTQKHI